MDNSTILGHGLLEEHLAFASLLVLLVVGSVGLNGLSILVFK